MDEAVVSCRSKWKIKKSKFSKTSIFCILFEAEEEEIWKYEWKESKYGVWNSALGLQSQREIAENLSISTYTTLYTVSLKNWIGFWSE